MPDQDWNARRSDARRNHESVLNAAIEVFTEHGLDATIPEIAARAGVGKATVYRSYPTKADLIRAIGDLHIEWLRQQITLASQSDDAFRGLEWFVVSVMSRLAEDRLMVEVFSNLHESGDEIVRDDAAHDHHAAAMRALLARASAAGQIRDDVTELDFQVVIGGAARALIQLEITDLALWERYARMGLAALRP